MSFSVLSALRDSSKGQLSYKSQLDNDTPTEIKKAYLETLNTPVMSPEAIQIIEGMSRLSLDRSRLTPQRPPATAVHKEETDWGDFPTGYSLHGGDSPSPLTTPGESDDETKDMSVIEEYKQDLEEEMRSIDDRLMEEMENNIRSRRDWFQAELLRLKEQARDRQLRCEREREYKLETEHQKRSRDEEKSAKDIEQKLRDIKEEFLLLSEKAKAKLKSGEEKRKEIKMIEERERRQAVEKLLSACQHVIEAAVKAEGHVTAVLSSCKHPKFLEKSALDKARILLPLIQSIRSDVGNEKQSGYPEQAKVAKCQELLALANQFIDKLRAAVDEANTVGEREAKQMEEAAKKLNADKLAKQAATQQQASQTGNQTTTGQPQQATATSSSSVDDSRLSISKSMLELYSSLQDLLSQTTTTCASLISTQDPRLKKYRFDLQKAVTATINSVSNNNGQALMEKIGQIRKLLSGQSVQVGTRAVSIRDHPDARAYCLNLLAAKIVKQGENESSNTQSVFPLSALTVGIWSEFEELGHYLLAHLYSVCPVLVPMYVNQTPGITEADYLKSLGYKVSAGGVVESQDLFLNRVRGTVRLYAAMVQTPQLPGRSSPHPHGLEHGWAWLARMLNVQPHPIVTAAALGEFIEIAGHALMKRYAKQFQKLLFVLWKEYIPKIEKITAKTDQGSLSRLKLFIENCIAAGKLPQPKGCLTNQFWSTRSQGITIA